MVQPIDQACPLHQCGDLVPEISNVTSVIPDWQLSGSGGEYYIRRAGDRGMWTQGTHHLLSDFAPSLLCSAQDRREHKCALGECRVFNSRRGNRNLNHLSIPVGSLDELRSIYRVHNVIPDGLLWYLSPI